MNIASVQNGIAHDTISLANSGDDGAYIHSHNILYYGTTSGTTAFFLNESRIGLLDCCLSIVAGNVSDTTCTWYHGPISTVSTGSYTFNHASLWTIQIRDGSSPRFWYPTDMYYVANYGVVKMVTHQPSGDIQWDLMNYKIVN
jgi:hypothetical protein